MSTRENRLHVLNIAHVRATQNALRNAARHAAIETLDPIVASTTDMALAARQAHWNVRGRQFTALHELFGQIADELGRQVNTLAMRSAALGGMPRCTAQSVAAATKLKPYPGFGSDGAEHVAELSRRMSSLGTELRQSILDIEGHGDPVTAHLLTEACAKVDHLLWLLESQIPVDEPGPLGHTPF